MFIIKFGSSFELSFRRSLFSLILLIIYLIISTILISLIGQIEILKNRNYLKNNLNNNLNNKEKYLEFERNELINTLWADSLAVRKESDWKQLANSKLDFYEKIILSSKISNNYCENNLISTTHNWDFISSLRSLFLIISTVGESSSTQKQFNGIFIKLFTIIILLIGIPLLLIYLENSIKTIFAFCEDNFEKPNLVIILIYFWTILIITLIIFLNEEEKEKNSFFDLFFLFFILSFKIFGNLNFNKISIWLFLPLFLIIFSLNGCLLKYLIKLINNLIAPHEFDFANGFYGKIERAVSGVDIQIEEINNNEDSNFKQKIENNQNSEENKSSPHFSIEGEEEINNSNNSTTNQIFSEILRRKSISTIAEEEGELPNSP